MVITQGLVNAFPHLLRRLAKPHRFQLPGYRRRFLSGFPKVFLSVDRFKHRRNFLDLALWYHGKNIAVEVNYAPLPLGLRIKLAQGLHQPQTFVGSEQLHALKPPFFQVPQERTPASLVFLGSLAYTQDLPVAFFVYANRLPARRRSLLHRPSSF